MGIKRDSRRLKERLRGKWLAAFSYLAGDLLTPAIERLGENVTCPIDGDLQGFRLFKDANETGGGVKQNRLSEGVFPDGITLLMEVMHLPFTTVFDNLAQWLDGRGKKTGNPLYADYYPPQPIDTTVHNDSDLREWLNNLWQHSVRFDRPEAVVARVYLNQRHILTAALAAKSLRFNPALSYKDSDGRFIGKFPGITALVRDNDGLPVALHRTYLTRVGEKLSKEGCVSRKMTPSLSGGTGRVVHLGSPMNGVLGLAEGLETALSVIQATGMPVWSCLSAAFMPQFVPPSDVNTVMVFVDMDRSGAGQESARKLAENLTPKGINVIPMVPLLARNGEKSVDWANQLDSDLSKGTDAMSVVRSTYQKAVLS
jgi:putative DNA primase/helicase